MESVYEPVYKGRIRALFEGGAARINRHIAAHFGDRIPLYCVVEVPRSGGTWLASMMADYLRCAKPGASVLPSACRAVMHSHWQYHRKLKRTVYLVRDGRDVFVSLYFHVLRAYRDSAAKIRGNDRIRRKLAQALGVAGSKGIETVGFGDFLRIEIARPTMMNGVHWGQHVREWYDPKNCPAILYLRYEDVLLDPVANLKRAVEHVSPVTTDERLLRRSVDHFSMESITGRTPGDEDIDSFVRKGISGDWKNHFTQDIAVLFDNYAGDLLIELGYEKDRSWIERCPNP